MPIMRPLSALFQQLHLTGLEKLGLGLAVSGATEALGGPALTLYGGFSHNMRVEEIGVGMLCAAWPSLAAALLIFCRPSFATNRSNRP